MFASPRPGEDGLPFPPAQKSRMAPLSAEVTILAYRARYPVLLPGKPASLGPGFDWTCSAEMNSSCAKVFLRKTLVRPHLRARSRLPQKSKIAPLSAEVTILAYRARYPVLLPGKPASLGPGFDWTCSAEMNSACAKVFLRKTLVRPHLRARSRLPQKSKIAPLSAEVTILAYRARYPVLTLGSGHTQAARRLASSSSETSS